MPFLPPFFSVPSLPPFPLLLLRSLPLRKISLRAPTHLRRGGVDSETSVWERRGVGDPDCWGETGMGDRFLTILGRPKRPKS